MLTVSRGSRATSLKASESKPQIPAVLACHALLLARNRHSQNAPKGQLQRKIAEEHDTAEAEHSHLL